MKVGMIFPGYGSQFVGMAKELYDNSRIIQEYFEEASHCLELNFVKLCFASSDIELSKLNNAYPALFLIGRAVAEYLKELEIKIDCLAGYGIGEYSALSFAGGLSFADGLYLLKKLANFYLDIRQNLDIKSVIIDGLSSRKLKQICLKQSSDEGCAQIAIYEKAKEHIVTGHPEAVDAVVQQAYDEGANAVEADSHEAFHTPLLNPLTEQLRLYLNKVDFKDLNIPLISNLNGKEIQKAQKAQETIMGQIIKPIYWFNVLRQLAQLDVILVVAPAKGLVREIQAIYPTKIVMGIDTMLDVNNVLEFLKSNKIQKKLSSESLISDIMDDEIEQASI